VNFLRKAIAVFVRLWALYMTDWVLGGVTATAAYFVRTQGAWMYVYGLLVYLVVIKVQSRLTHSFVDAYDLPVEQRTLKQRKHIDFTVGCFAPVNGVGKLGIRVSEKLQKWDVRHSVSSSNKPCAARYVMGRAVFAVSAFAAGSYLLMSYRYTKTKDQGGTNSRNGSRKIKIARAVGVGVGLRVE
jgi:hypothetical protein